MDQASGLGKRPHMITGEQIGVSRRLLGWSLIKFARLDAHNSLLRPLSGFSGDD
jgi:hypothetical protein